MLPIKKKNNYQEFILKLLFMVAQIQNKAQYRL